MLKVKIQVKYEKNGIYDFDQMVNDNDLFLKVRSKIEDQLNNIERDAIFYVYNGQILLENSRMKKYKIVEGGAIEIYQIQDMLKYIQNDSNQTQPQNQQQTQIQSQELQKLKEEFKQLQQQKEYIENQLNSQINTLKQYLDKSNIDEQDYLAQIEQLKINNQEIQNSIGTKEKYEALMRQSQLQKYQQLNSDLMQAKRNYDKIQSDLEEKEYERKMLECEIKLIRKENQELANNSKSGHSQIKLVNEQTLSKLSVQYDEIMQRYTNEQNQNSQNKIFLEQTKQKLNDLNKNYTDICKKCQNVTLELEYKETEFTNLKQEYAQFKDQIEFKLKNVSHQLKEEKQTNLTNQNSLYQLQLQKTQSEKTIEELKKTILDLEQQFKQEKQEAEKQRQKIQEVKGQLTDKELELSNQIQTKENQLNRKTKECERYQNEINSLKLEKTENEGKIKGFEKALESLKTQAKTQQDQDQKDIQKEKEKQYVLENKIKQLTTKIKKSVATNKPNDGKIISPTEMLFRNGSDINNFEKDGNVFTNDDVCEVSSLQVNVKILEDLLKKGDLEIQKAIQQQSLGTWNIKRSINPNAEGTKRSLYLLRVTEEPSKNFNGKLFVIKEIQNNTISNIEAAIQVAANSVISKFLLDYFQKKLQGASDQRIPTNLKFQEQYMLICEGKIFIAEPLYPDGKYIKYNGVGDSTEKDSKITMFLNAFSLFSYHFSSRQFMISNLQGFGDNLYDSIINTNEGIFNEEDLGEDEIIRMLGNYRDDPKSNGKQLLLSLAIKL